MIHASFAIPLDNLVHLSRVNFSRRQFKSKAFPEDRVDRPAAAARARARTKNKDNNKKRSVVAGIELSVMENGGGEGEAGFARTLLPEEGHE